MEAESTQVQMARQEMMFWFQQELRRREALAKGTWQRIIGEHAEEMEAVKAASARVVDAAQVALVASQEKAEAATGQAERKAAEVAALRGAIDGDIAWMKTIPCTQVSNDLDEAIAISAAAFATREDTFPAIAQQVQSLHDDLAAMRASDEAQKRALEAGIVTRATTNNQLDQLRSRLQQAQNETQRQMAQIENEWTAKLDRARYAHEVALDLERSRREEATRFKEEAVSRLDHVQGELARVRQELGTELATRALVEQQLVERQKHELETTIRIGDDRVRTVSNQLAILKSELELARAENVHLQRDGQVKEGLVREQRRTIYDMKSRLENQAQERTTEIDVLRRDHDVQTRRLEHAQALLQQVGVEGVPSHTASSSKPTVDKRISLATTDGRSSSKPKKAVPRQPIVK